MTVVVQVVPVIAPVVMIISPVKELIIASVIELVRSTIITVMIIASVSKLIVPPIHVLIIPSVILVELSPHPTIHLVATRRRGFVHVVVVSLRRWLLVKGLLLLMLELIAWLLHLVLNNRRVPELRRWVLLLLLLTLLPYGMVVPVSHPRVAQVVYGWVHMAKLARPFHQDWCWCHWRWSHGWWRSRWTGSKHHLCLQISHGLHAWHCRGRESIGAGRRRLEVGWECLGMLRVGERLGQKLGWWGHLGQGHDCWILKMSIGGRSKVGRRQEWELWVLRVGNHLLRLLMLLLLLLLHVHPMHGLCRLLVALLQLHGHHLGRVGLHSEWGWEGGATLQGQLVKPVSHPMAATILLRRRLKCILKLSSKLLSI